MERNRFYEGMWELGLAAVIAVVAAQAALACNVCRNRKCADPCSRERIDRRLSRRLLHKPMPCVPCLQHGYCPDNYCRKPMPCMTCSNTRWCPDDYCRKPMPCVCRPPRPVKFLCSPCPSR